MRGWDKDDWLLFSMGALALVMGAAGVVGLLV